MANFFLSLCVFKIALPILLTVCIIFRPTLLSAIYLLLFLCIPLVPVPSVQSMAGYTGIYLKILLGVSVLTAISQFAFQIVLLAMPPYANFLKDCELLEKILRHAGFVRLDNISATAATTWLTPEIVMLVGSIVVFVTCNKLTALDTEIRAEGGILLLPKDKIKKRLMAVAVAVGKYVTLASLCLAAILRPSVQGGLYFLIFLSAATWCACYKELEKGFAVMVRCLMVIVFLHIGALYTYQFQWPQELLDSNSTYARYFGLTPLMSVNCDDPREFIWSNVEWASYLNPLMLLWLYFVLAIQSKLLLKPQLIRGVSPSRKYGASTKKPTGILQDSTGSVTVSGDGQDDIPMEQLEEEEEDEKPTLLDNVIYAAESLVQVLIRASYIVTNIIMMAWSITFHSWITFVLLLWANILWMIPNQRRAMLRCTPFLVLYAWFLLIAGYIFSMNLTDEELPQVVGDVDLGPIGFEKISDLPCKFLLVKCLFTSMFWISLKQYMKERQEARQTSTLADMVAPLQVTVGTAAGISRDEAKGNKTMEKVGQYIKSFLTKFWIWVVAITLFAVAITGERMTGFRIIYMALFLIFILSFQLSFRIWRKMMFGFWLTVILYSMLILVLVYTYQFKNIQQYWTEYLHVPKQQQLDIGLEDYGPKQLFIRLVTPTFFVIITVVQLHYFHRDFLLISDPKNTGITDPLSEGSSAQGGILEPNSEKTDFESSVRFDLTDIGNISKIQIQETLKNWLNKIHRLINLIYLFLEIHLPKIVLLLAVLLCIYDKCAIYLAVVILIVLSCTMGRPVYLFSMYSTSALVSLMVLARMVYQIEYIEHDMWNVTCDNMSFINSTENETNLNNAEWLGFRKIEEGITLPHLVKWNIIYILAVTLWSVVLVRQNNYRISRGRPTKTPYFMFPRIKRSDADKNIQTCLKYLLNYGFYKFGIEICLMATVATIGFRMDIYAAFYAIWLCVLLSLNRKTLNKIWSLYFFFIAIMIPIQYVMLIGLPPSLCTAFPWDSNEILRRFQEWAFLIDFKYALPAKKLICDFVLLLLVSRQALVFRIENRSSGHEYPGGSNESIIYHAEEKGFVNPVPDFITYCRSYLDVVKRAIYLSFFWITLAIVFLAGTNRVSFFSGGYLIGSFIFLWQGSDLYLRPLPRILRAWNWLLGYNVAVILMKTILQIAGCIYVEALAEHACWFVQIMAIGCVKKFTPVAAQARLKDPDQCDVPREYIGLVWDGICFAFLIIQRRIFSSYNFFHMVNETKAITILASRGADLIEELRQKRMREKEEVERRILEKIKAKMDKIKANQQKLQGPSYRDSTNHFIDGIFPGSRPSYRKRMAKSYKEAIRSGDYYMFDDDDEEEELELIEESEPTGEDLEDEKERKASLRGPTLSEVGSGQPHSVVIIDPKSTKDEVDKEPQPGTSKDEDMSELTEPKEDTLVQKILNYLLFVWVFLESAMISLTLFLNQYSREHRYVLRVLNREKKILKERTEYNVGLRLGRGQKWQPVGSYHTLLKEPHRQDSPINLLDEYEGADEMSSVDQPPIIRLLLSLWYIVLSHSDILCYFMIFLNQIKSATFLSLPLPLMVFCWGTLTIPRPSKTFWITIIAYTEIIVLVKCIFQFEILPWNRSQNLSPFYPPRIIGIEKRPDYALWDLLLLLIVFFHRFLLKSLGLWKSMYVPAAILPDGEYKISNKELQAIEQDSTHFPSTMTAGGSGSIRPIKANGRKGSDLQKLVEESEESVEGGEQKDSQSTTSEDQIVSIRTEHVNPFTQLSTSFRMGIFRYADSMKVFFQQLLDPASRVATDVYSYMFLCDFFNFFVLLIGYSSFGAQQGDEGVSSYLEDNRVPVLFLLMLILQFAIIIIDRAIFLRKYIIGKVIFQFIQIVVLHIWLFIIYPSITERGFNSVIPPQMYYMVKCFYLLLSAYQIRCGYPTRILGNFICKGYSYLNMFLFKGFMAIPFLFELRTVMDWMWTDTSMTVFDWIKMEDIFAHIFQLKCARHIEDEFPQPRGERKSPIVKYFMGGAALSVMIAVIWFPLVFFSLGNAVGTFNVPYDVSIAVRIGPYQPIYHMSVQSNSIFSFNDTDVDRLIKVYNKNKVATTFINNYEGGDVAAVKFSMDSATTWSISPPDRQRMLQEVGSNVPLIVHFQYEVSHKSNTKEDTGIIKEEISIRVEAMINGKPNPVRENLFKMLNGTKGVEPIPFEYVMPKFIKVTNKGTAKFISQLMDNNDKGKLDNALRNITIKHESSVGTETDPRKEWWEVREECNDANYENYLKALPYSDCSSLIMYTFNDKRFPSTLNFITGGGIIGVYTTLVLVAGRLLRGFFAGMCFKIMFEDLPNVDRILQLCFDIYLVREAGEFCLEEDLFAKLVFLFRSPETLIKWTRPKEEINDDEDEDEEDNSQQ